MKERNTVAHWITYMLYLLLGVGLVIGGITEQIDSFWSGMGSALLCVGALRMIGLIRYKTDAAYKEQTDTAVTDERNRFLRMKAWSWTGYLFILIAAVATIVFKLLDMEPQMFMASGAVCLVVVLYWVCYLLLRRKY